MEIDPEVQNSFSFRGNVENIKDYQIDYTLIGMDLEKEFVQIFPRIGYLVCNLFIGDSLQCRFLNYSGETFYRNRLYISGLYSKGPMIFSLKNKGKGYAIKIHPVIGHHLLKLPMTQTIDRRVRVSDALSINDGLLRKLEESDKIESIGNRHLQHFLWNALPDKNAFLNDPIYHAVNTIIGQKGMLSVKKLASRFCMSERTLRRQFLLKVGLSPQAYTRIWKVHHAVELIRGNPKLNLEEVAWKSGYYDVAHLAHDFKYHVKTPPSLVAKNLSDLAQNYFDNKSLNK